MGGKRGTAIAWSGAVTTAAIALATLFAVDKSPFDHILFISFTAIAVIAFLLLLSTPLIRTSARPPSSTVEEAARSLASARADQVRGIDEMAVRWEISDATRTVMPAGLATDDRSSSQFAGEFGKIGLVFTEMRPPRIVILGEAGTGKTTLVSKLFLELLGRESELGIPVSIPAAKWGANQEITRWIATQLRSSYTATWEALKSGKIFPILEDYDELPPPLRLKAIKRINALTDAIGLSTPLVVTSRPEAYMYAVSKGRIQIRKAAVAKLKPLELSDEEKYLTEDSLKTVADRWKYALAKAPDGPLASALANPLMLWLARKTYEGSRADPRELITDPRFRDQQSIEDHLLDSYVPGKFSNDDAFLEPSVRRRRRWTGRQAERWLSFLAADLQMTRSRDLAWWRIPEMSVGGRPLTYALRGALLVATAWYATAWADHRLGGLGHAVDPALLVQGPLGRQVTPIVSHLHSSLLYSENHGLRTAVTSASPYISLPILELLTIVIAVANGVFHAMFDVLRPGGATGDHISLTKIRARSIPLAAGFALFIALILSGFIAGAILVVPGNQDPQFITSLLYQQSTWILIAAILLWSLTFSVEMLLTERLDISRPSAPLDISRLSSAGIGFQLQKRHTLVLLLFERPPRMLILWLIFGPTIALAYGAYETVAISCKMMLGGRLSAWDVFADGRLWLACRRLMPWRIMRFLAEAEGLGILRQLGGVYQFRHIRMQERLANRYMQYHMPFSRRLIHAIMPVIRWWARRSGLTGQRIDWRPKSVAPWTLPLWSLRFEDCAQLAKASGTATTLDGPVGDIRREGPGVSQDFINKAGGPPWVLCSLPSQMPTVVAGPVWQALRLTGQQVLGEFGIGGTVNGLTAVGFPQDTFVAPDATRMNLHGGSLGAGVVERGSQESPWRWEPTWSFSGGTGSPDIHSDPARLRLAVEACMDWDIPRLQIQDDRYRALAGILAEGDLIAPLAALRTSSQTDLLIRETDWRESESDRRNRSLIATIDRPGSGPSFTVKVNVRVAKVRNSTQVHTGVQTEVIDLPTLPPQSDQFSEGKPPLSSDALVTYFATAWRIATDVLPVLVVYDPVAVSPVVAPDLSMSTLLYQHHETADIRSLVEFSPFELRNGRRVTSISMRLKGPLFNLANDERNRRTRQALNHLIRNSGH